jgi:hypothetical protein
MSLRSSIAVIVPVGESDGFEISFPLVSCSSDLLSRAWLACSPRIAFMESERSVTRMTTAAVLTDRCC